MNNLVEAVARALADEDRKGTWMDSARVALAAIDASGTHRVVTVKDQRTTVGDMDVVDWLLSAAEDPELEVYGYAMRWAAGEINRYREMLEARPRITGEEA